MAVNIARALADGAQRFMPENLALTVGESAGVPGLAGLIPLAMRFLQTREDLPRRAQVAERVPAAGDGNSHAAPEARTPEASGEC